LYLNCGYDIAIVGHWKPEDWRIQCAGFDEGCNIAFSGKHAWIFSTAKQGYQFRLFSKFNSDSKVFSELGDHNILKNPQARKSPLFIDSLHC